VVPRFGFELRPSLGGGAGSNAVEAVSIIARPL
jgi:hypothetical protein